MAWLAVAIGGAAGAVLRYAATGWVQALTGSVFPWGTLAVNVAGSLALGAIMHLATERFLVPLELRLLLATGLCGALTTFSTFAYETLALLQANDWAGALANTGLNVVACLVAAYAGLVLARLV